VASIQHSVGIGQRIDDPGALHAGKQQDCRKRLRFNEIKLRVENIRAQLWQPFLERGLVDVVFNLRRFKHGSPVRVWAMEIACSVG
jgi:hypothetical protein